MSEEIINAGGCGPAQLPLVLEKIVRLHGDKWLALAKRMVQNREDAEDVLQESVVKMLMRGRCFRSSDEARMYFGRVLCNTAIQSYHRRRRQRLQYCSLYEQAVPASAVSEPLVSALGRDECQKTRILNLLQLGLERLPAKQREALHMTFMNARSVSLREAGVAHDIPYSTLRHRRTQGLRRMKKFFHKALRTDRANEEL